MLGIGASTDYRLVIKYIKKPTAYLLGVITQLLLVPLLAWALTVIFTMTQEESLSVMIQGCSPGGSTSNVVVYWMGGILDLSVAMTGTTTILALGMMPFWLWVFSKVTTLSDDLAIPFDTLGITLASLLPPIVIGMIINAKMSERCSTIISKVCIMIGSIGIVVITITGTIVRDLTWIITWRIAMVAVLMPLLGFALGYVITLIPIFGLNRRISRTVATEVALQNAQVCSAVIQGSFQATTLEGAIILGKMVVFPLLYYCFQVGYSVIFVVIYKVMKKKGYFADETSLPLEAPEGKMAGEEGITTIENVYSKDFNDGDGGGNDLNKVSAGKSLQSHNQLPGYAHSERL